KKAIVRSTVNAAKMRRTTLELPPQKSPGSTASLVTLHRPPPLTRILAPTFAAPSKTVTRRPGFRRAVKIAAARPAAPAPTTTTSRGSRMGRHHKGLQAAVPTKTRLGHGD